MRDRRWVLLFVLCFFLVYLSLFAGGSREGEVRVNNGEERQKIYAVVSIMPQKYIVERIGGEKVKVDVLVDPGSNPHTMEPTPKQIVSLADADVLFTIGFPFERRLVEKIRGSGVDLRIVETDRGIERRSLEDHGEEDSDDEVANNQKGSSDGHGEADPHIWLSARNLKNIAENIMEKLVEIDPEGGSYYRKNFKQLSKEIDETDAYIRDLLKPFRGRTIFVLHPAYGYFADDYGLNQMSVEKHGRSPGPRELKELIEEARREKVGVIFVQPQYDLKPAWALADSIGGKVIKADPFAYDVIEMLRMMAIEIKRDFNMEKTK